MAVVPGSLWVYAPTKGVSVVFAVLFAISGVLHIWQNHIKYKSWRIGFLLPWAAALFTAGFILREYGAYHYDDLNVFIASTVILFVAPPVYNGADYFILGRALYYLPYLSPLHPGRVWTTFVALDSIDGILAGTGAAYASNSGNTLSQIHTGLVLVKVSLFLLIGMFCCFVLLVIIFHHRCIRAGVLTYKTKVIIYEIYLSSVLILIRNCFRTAAFFYPYNSVANDSEALWYCLEALPMLINSYLMNVYPPGKYLPANNKIYLAMDGKTELEGPGMVDKRPFILTLLDPFDIAGLISGRDSKNRFWETDGIGGATESHSVEAGNVSLQRNEGSAKM